MTISLFFSIFSALLVLWIGAGWLWVLFGYMGGGILAVILCVLHLVRDVDIPDMVTA